MKKSECCKKIAAGLVCACVFFRTANVLAQIAASNPEGTKHNFKTFLNNMKNGVYLQKGMEYMSIGTAAIGDPLGTVSEYVDKENFEMIRKAKEDYENYKKRAEDYKKEYEEYKAWAKQVKNEAESTVDTVKSTAEMAKDLPGSVGGVVDSAKGQLSGAVGSVTGEINGIAGSVGVDASGVTDSLTGQDSSGGSQETGGDVDTTTASNTTVSENLSSQTGSGNSVQSSSQPAASTAGGQSSSRQAFTSGSSNMTQSSGAPVSTSANVNYTDNAVSSKASVVDDVSSVNNVRSDVKAMVTENQRLQKASSVAGEMKIKDTASQISTAQTLKASAAPKAVRADMNTVNNTKTINTQKAITRKAISNQEVKKLQPVKTQMRRKTFKTLEKQSSVKNDDIVRTALISHSEPLAFAYVGSPLEKDDGTDPIGSILVPPTIALVTGVGSGDVRKAGTMDKVLVKMNDSLKGAQVGKEDVGTYLLQGKRELTAAYIAEAFKAQKETEDFGVKVINSLDTAPSNNAIDQYGNINEMNKAMVKAMNGFLQTKASRLMLDSYENYMTFGFSSPEQKRTKR